MKKEEPKPPIASTRSPAEMPRKKRIGPAREIRIRTKVCMKLGR